MEALASVIAILVPVLARPHRAFALVSSIARSTSVAHRIVFLCTPGDVAEIAACSATADRARGTVDVLVCPFERRPGDFARKTNHGLRETSEPWLFLGADDLDFRPGWDVACLRSAEQTGARLIGTNDLGNPLVRRGEHATHTLVARSYAEERGTIDEPGKIYHEGYGHQWVDNELVETAKARGEWAFAADAIVEHLHPLWPDERGGHKGAMDETYTLGLSSSRADRALFLRRRRLWRAGRRAA